MERYSEYKDSGVKWLGEIPSHWEVVPIKHSYKFTVGWTPPTGRNDLFEGNNLWANISDLGDKVIRTTTNHISDSAVRQSGRSISPKGSLLYSFKLSVGTVSFCGADMYTNEAIATFLKGKNSLEFLYYAAPIFIIKNANTNIYGAPILNQDLIKNALVLLPPLSEQDAIVRYLDSATSEIDKAIAMQQKMIGLLNERKQIIIQNAVTKGLDENVEMKESGVEWIGKIPKHWEVRRGKFLFRVVNEYSTTGQEELLTVSDRTGITPRSMKNVNMFMSEYLIGYKKCQKGDICSNIMWMWHGAVGVTEYNGVISPSYGVYRQIAVNYDNKYLDYMLRLPRLVEVYGICSTGLTESRLRLYPDDFMNIQFFIPPVEEQKSIVLQIQKQITDIEKSIRNAENLITLLQERKQIIINEVVTGKVRVS